MVQTEVLLVILCTFSTAVCQFCPKCRIHTVHRLKSADCHKLEFTEVPKCLSSGIEVLDLSYNRILEIHKHDLDLYPNVQFLYLSDNLLRKIEDETFSDKPYLRLLDLSNGGLYKLPTSIFHLPQLWKLYLANIASPQMVKDIEDAVPITSPIEYLDLSRNQLPKLPDFGDFPTLKFLNVSGNGNVLVNVSTFSGLCSLETFSNEDFEAIFEDQCECLYLNDWLTRRGVKFKNFTCENNLDCNSWIKNEYVINYESCKNSYEEYKEKIFRQQILTNTGIGLAVIIALIIILSMILLRSKKNKKRKMEQHEQERKRRKFNDKNYE